MKFSGKVGNGPMNKRLNLGNDLDTDLDTGIVFRIRHYWEIWKVVSTDCAGCATLQRRACTSRHRHSNYGVITSPAHDRQWDWYRDTGKTCLGGGTHCPCVSSSKCPWMIFVGYLFHNGVFVGLLITGCDMYDSLLIKLSACQNSRIVDVTLNVYWIAFKIKVQIANLLKLVRQYDFVARH